MFGVISPPRDLLPLIIIIIIIIQEFSFGTLEVHLHGNPQLVVQLPPQSTTHKTLGVMIYTKTSRANLPFLSFEAETSFEKTLAEVLRKTVLIVMIIFKWDWEKS